MTKLMITALLLCSSLAFAGDLTSAPSPQKKKPMKVMVAPASTAEAQPVLEGSSLGGLGTAGTGTAAKPKKQVQLRGTAPASTK